MATAELLSIGDELLLGRTLDTNAHWLADQLHQAGVPLARVQQLPDDPRVIAEALKEALLRAEVVLTTGGLGPTSDDKTRDALREVFGGSIVTDETAWQKIEAYYKARGRALNPNAHRMAYVLETALALDNPAGASPGMFFEAEGGRLAFALPGVPREMKAIFSTHILPRLVDRFSDHILRTHTFRLVGIPESSLAAKLSDFEAALPPEFSLAYNPNAGRIDLRLQLRGPATEAERLLAEFQARQQELPAALVNYHYAEGDTSLEEAIGLLLQANGLHIALAESLTGGSLAARLLSVPGASAYAKGAVVAYQNEIKTHLLGVPAALLASKGAVCSETAVAMAKGVRAALHADIGLSTTGIAGPSGGTMANPTGTFYVGYADAHTAWARRFQFPGERDRVIELADTTALHLLWLQLTGRALPTGQPEPAGP